MDNFGGTGCNLNVSHEHRITSFIFHHPFYDANQLTVDFTKINRKVQEEPQAEAAANPRHQKEEKKRHRPTVHTQQTNARQAQRPAPSSPSNVIKTLKRWKKHIDKE